MNRDEEIAIEWDCQKLLRQYYHYVDQKEYEKAAELFTPDVEWSSMSVVLKGRDDIIVHLAMERSVMSSQILSSR